VRWMAWRAMQRLATGALRTLVLAYDPHAEAAERLPAIDALRAALGPGALPDDRRQALEARQDAALLWIGE
jgi:hypothetical protein